MPLYGQSPESLQGQDHVGDNGICEGEVEDEVVEVGLAPGLGPAQYHSQTDSQLRLPHRADCSAEMTRARPFSTIPTGTTASVSILGTLSHY